MISEVINIFVYADWYGLNGPRLMGTLNAQRIRGKEVFSFEYDPKWLSFQASMQLDPNLGFYPGKQYVPAAQTNFGVFLDSSPDRWGRMLMRRREAWLAKIQNRKAKPLFESDYLLGVFDAQRMGSLRFKTEPDGAFLNDMSEIATPPWTTLRELEFASLQLEAEEATTDQAYEQWLRLLIAPGSSLGGARPKAGVLDKSGNLWIAKFPSSLDEKNIAAWEMVLHDLAEVCGIIVPEAKVQRFSGKHHTYLSKRFDRIGQKGRIHFASAMTLLGYQDGTDFQDYVSYLDIAGFIKQHGASVKQDLKQLWKRILFNVLVSNTDDHLRNHGFILTNSGWQLSPAFDMNPNETGTGLTLNITEHSNILDISLVMDTAPHYSIKSKEAVQILKEMSAIVSGWQYVAKKHGLGNAEIAQIKPAFQLAEVII